MAPPSLAPRLAAPMALTMALVLGSCGGATTTATTATTAPAHLPVQRGTKGERPGQEAESTWHIGRGACARLAAEIRGRLGVSVERRAEPSPPLSRCRISGPRLDVNVYLDAGFAAHQRYENRMEETYQFGVPDRRRLPHPVAGVGEAAAGNHDANWIPAEHALYAVRGNRWVTVDVAIPALSERRLLSEAASLADAAFRLATR